MSFNKKRLPELSILVKNHEEIGDTYLDQFKSCDVLVGPADSAQYLCDFFKSHDTVEHMDEVLSLLTEASSILFKRASSKYQKDFEDLEKVINSITNK